MCLIKYKLGLEILFESSNFLKLEERRRERDWVGSRFKRLESHLSTHIQVLRPQVWGSSRKPLSPLFLCAFQSQWEKPIGGLSIWSRFQQWHDRMENGLPTLLWSKDRPTVQSESRLEVTRTLMLEGRKRVKRKGRSLSVDRAKARRARLSYSHHFRLYSRTFCRTWSLTVQGWKSEENILMFEGSKRRLRIAGKPKR